MNKSIWTWLYLGGALVAALAGAFGFSNDILTIILVILGFIVGLLAFETEDLMNAGIRYLVFAITYNALGALPAVGSYLTGFFGGWFNFLAPVFLARGIMYMWKKYMGK